MWGALEAGLAVGVCITLIAVLAACVCGWRKQNPKSELVGTAGVLKLHSEEVDTDPGDNTPLSAKRISAQNSQRSLPEIPVPVPRQDSGDTASELYATVGLDQRPVNQSPKNVRTEHPYEHAYASLQEGVHRAEEPVAVISQLLVGNSSSDDVAMTSADVPQNPESVVISASIAISGQLPSSQELPYMTPPVTIAAPTENAVAAPTDNQVATLRTDNVQHFSGDSTDSTKGYTSISVREPLSSIRANIVTSQLQPHYASVSDDSDEMYAAIDEPNQAYTSGSETYAQIQPTVQTVQPVLHAPPPKADSQNGLSDQIVDQGTSEGTSHSRGSQTVIDKADSTFRWSMTNDIHALGNSTHSRQESSSSGTNSMGALGSPKPEKRQANSPLPPPPPPTSSTEVRKSQDSPLHHTKIGSRQQRISSTGDLNSNHDILRRSLNEKHQRNNSCVSSSDFYGCNYPVDKHRFSSGDLSRPLVARELNFNIDTNTYSNVDPLNDPLYNMIEGMDNDKSIYENHNMSQQINQQKLSPMKNVEEMYAKVIKKNKLLISHENRSRGSSRLSNYDDVDSVFKAPTDPRQANMQDEDMYTILNESASNQNVKPAEVATTSKNLTVKANPDREDPGYETIDRLRGKSHGYETIDKIKVEKFHDPGYETVRDPSRFADKPQTSSGNNQRDLIQRINQMKHDAFASGPDSILSSDPGYEHILWAENGPSDYPPTPPYASIQNFSHDAPVYSSINKKIRKPSWPTNNNDFLLSEPNYESMPHESSYNAGSESDPKYESVGPKDPKYESVKYCMEPPYDKVQSDISSERRSSRCSSSGYERIKTKQDDRKDSQVLNGSRPNATDSATVSDYFQV